MKRPLTLPELSIYIKTVWDDVVSTMCESVDIAKRETLLKCDTKLESPYMDISTEKYRKFFELSFKLENWRTAFYEIKREIESLNHA